MLSDRGAAARLAVADLPPLDGIDHLHLSGYVLGAGSRAAGLAALEAARRAGASTSVDPQSTGIRGRTARPTSAGVDLLLPNAEELAVLIGSPEPDAAGLAGRGARGGRSRPGTRGRAGWIATGSGRCTRPPCDVVDTTGAGDAFDAGLLAAWLGGADPEAALRAGCAAGAEAVSRRGARPPVRRRA